MAALKKTIREIVRFDVSPIGPVRFHKLFLYFFWGLNIAFFLGPTVNELVQIPAAQSVKNAADYILQKKYDSSRGINLNDEFPSAYFSVIAFTSSCICGTGNPDVLINVTSRGPPLNSAL